MLKLKGLLLTADIEKTFDSVNNSFLLKVLENYDFNQDFLKWISVLFQNQESCVMNGDKITRYLENMVTNKATLFRPTLLFFHFYQRK